MSDLNEWLSKAGRGDFPGYPGDGGSEHTIGQMGGSAPKNQRKPAAGGEATATLESTTGNVEESKKVVGMHDGTDTKVTPDDDTGIDDKLDPTSRTEGPFAPPPEGSNAVRGMRKAITPESVNKAMSAPPVEKDPDEEDPNAEEPGDDDLEKKADESYAKSYEGMITTYFAKGGGGPYIGKRGGKWADPDHKIPWNDKKHSGKPTPKAKDHDDVHARDIAMMSQHNFRERDSAEFHTMSSRDSSEHGVAKHRKAVQANLAKKMASGKYDHAQATKLWAHHAKVVNDHAKKHESYPAADPATRMAAAKEMADDFHEEAMAGEHDHHVPKKHKGKSLKDLHGGGMEKASPRPEVNMSDLNALGDWIEKGSSVLPNTRSGTGPTDGLQNTNPISPATKGKNSPKGSGPTDASTRGSDSTAGAKNLKTDQSYSELEGDEKTQGVKGAAGGNRGGGGGGDAAMGIDRERSDINDKRKLAKSLAAVLGREPTWEEMEKAMSGGLHTGDRKDMDETRNTGTGGVEVGRAEEGGKVAGVGSTGSGNPPQGGGSAGLEAKSLKNGDAYGANQSGADVPSGNANNGKLERLSDDDPKDTDEMKSNQAHQSSPESKTSGPLGAEREPDVLNKGWDNNQRYPSDVEQLDVNRQHAARVSLIKAGDGDLQVNVASARVSPDPVVNDVAVMVKGGVLYTDQGDREAAELAKGDSFYADAGPSVGMDARSQLRKSMACPSCGNATPAYLGGCQSCGSNLSKAQKQVPRILQHGPQKGPALRPVVEADLFLPNGVTED